MRKSLLLTSVVLSASSAGANAVGWKTQLNCGSDYYAYCSKFSVGSPELRKCMRANGPMLSKTCINALIADGEISQEEVAQHKEKIAAAEAKPKRAEPKKAEFEPKAAAKMAAAPQPPKLNIARALEPQAPSKPMPMRETISLDQKTFEALINRGPRFLTDENIDILSTPERPQQLDARQPPDVNEASKQPAQSIQPANAGNAANEIPIGTKDTPKSLVDDEPPAKAREYSEGRMSLGRSLPSAQAKEHKLSWWDELIQTLSGSDK